jgi:hypothetical protein
MKFTELQNTFICLEALKVRVKEKEKENKLLPNFLPSKFHTVRKQQEINGNCQGWFGYRNESLCYEALELTRKYSQEWYG